MADILFTHSYFLRFDPKEYKAMMPYPPLGTLYAAAYLRQHGFTVSLFDSMLADSERELEAALDAHKPEVVVIYDDDFNYLTKMCLARMREAAFAMSAIAKRRGCTVVVHGSDPTDHLRSYFDAGAEYVICGEGEETLLELLKSIRERTPLPDEIKGLAFLQEGRLIRTPARYVRKDLDELPFPARDLIDVQQYRTAWLERHGYFSVNMVTTRGCPFHCNWCAKPIYGQVYNSRTPADVVAEMKHVKATLNPDHIWFCDDIFGLKPGWVGAFADEVLRQDAIIPFKCLARADLLLKEQAVNNLKRAGCSTVWIGAESGSQNILDAMQKGTTVQQIREATALLKEAGIRVGFFLQFGYPGESRSDIDLTIAMVDECLPHEIGISISYPLPGTPFYDRVKTEMTEKQNWVDSEDLAMMFAGTFSPEFYRILHRVTHKHFRIAQSADLLKQAIRRPSTLNKETVRRITAGVYHRLTLPGYKRRLERAARTESSPQSSTPLPVES